MSSKTGETVDEVIWHMPAAQAIILTGMVIDSMAGKRSTKYREKFMARKMLDKIDEVTAK